MRMDNIKDSTIRSYRSALAYMYTFCTSTMKILINRYTILYYNTRTKTLGSMGIYGLNSNMWTNMYSVPYIYISYLLA